jgi:hypothetical protein
MLGAVAGAKKRLDNGPMEGMLENTSILTSTKDAAEKLKTAMYAVQNVPFAVLAVALKEVWDPVAGAGSEFNQKWNGMPAVIAKTAAVIGAPVVAIGLAHVKMTALGASTTYFSALLKSSLNHR